MFCSHFGFLLTVLETLTLVFFPSMRFAAMATMTLAAMLGTAPTAVQNEFEHLGSCELTDLAIAECLKSCLCAASFASLACSMYTRIFRFYAISVSIFSFSLRFLCLDVFFS